MAQAARSGRIQKKPRWELDLRLTVHNVKYPDRKYTSESASTTAWVVIIIRTLRHGGLRGLQRL